MKLTTVAILVVVGVCIVLIVTKPKKVEKAEKVAVAPRTNATGRADTRTLEAAGMVGYDGKQIRARVDKVLNQADQRDKAYREADQP